MTHYKTQQCIEADVHILWLCKQSQFSDKCTPTSTSLVKKNQNLEMVFSSEIKMYILYLHL